MRLNPFAREIEAADRWTELAAAEINMAHHYESKGLPFGSVDSYYSRARTYLKTAESLYREARTGQQHCSNCGSSHANHEHSAVASVDCRCGDDRCPWCGDPLRSTL